VFQGCFGGLIAGYSRGEETGCKKTDFARAADYA
jgi:hypothetical protein